MAIEGAEANQLDPCCRRSCKAAGQARQRGDRRGRSRDGRPAAVSRARC
jgi:hypothetical protein